MSHMKGLRMDLTPEDLVVIEQLASERTTTPVQFEEVKKKLVDGFTKFGKDNMISFLPTRADLFKGRADWLLENYHIIGKTSEEMFCSPEGIKHMEIMFRKFGVPQKDIDDEVQKAQIKFWRHKLAEKYNPLFAPWGYHISHALRTCFASYLASRSRNPVATGFSYQQYSIPGDTESGDLELEPYELEQDLLPEDKMIVREALADFEKFLENERPFRTKLFKGHKQLCTILPPGVKGLVIDEKLEAHVCVKGQKTYRVSPIVTETTTIPALDKEGNPIRVPLLWDSGDTILVPVTQVENLRDNPDYNASNEAVRIDRTPKDVYDLLINGLQVDEIAKALKVGESTAHNWARHIIELYELWWLQSSWIPENLKDLALPTHECPSCKKRHAELPEAQVRNASKFQSPTGDYHWCVNPEGSPRSGNWCLSCDTWDLSAIEAKVRITAHPWNPLKGTRDIQTRAAKYKTGMSVQHCSL
jgi:hypothetical protein